MTSVTRQINFKEAQERYELEAAPASFSVDGNGVCNDTVVVRLYHVKGGEKEEIQGDGVTLSVDGSSVGNFTLPLSLHTSTGSNDAHSAYVSSFLSAGSKNFLVSAAHGSNALTIPVIRNGEKGATPRIQAWSDLPVGYHFCQGTTGEGYKDTVIYNGNYYTCVKSHMKTSDNYPTSTTDTNNDYWKLGEKIELVATNLLLSAYAIIKNLGVEAIEMKDPKDPEDPNKILFQVKDGNVICRTGTFENITIGSGCVNYGVNRQPFVSGGGIEFNTNGETWLETELHDNLAFNDIEGGWQNLASLPFDQEANGRRILIVRSVWDKIRPYDITEITAPDGKYFFEDGLTNKSLKVQANEALLLVGYGDETNFMGWIVLQRIPMWTIHPHGSVQRVIYEGKCYENGTKLKYKAYNGAKLTCSRFGNGSYKISFGTPFKSTDEYEVMLTACGMNGDTSHAVYASLDEKNVSYFTVRCADDPSWNDASFLFQVIPTWDWITNS